MFVSSVHQKTHYEEKYDSGINAMTGMVSRHMIKFVVRSSVIQTDIAVVDRGADKYSGTEVLQSGTEGENWTEKNTHCSMLMILKNY